MRGMSKEKHYRDWIAQTDLYRSDSAKPLHLKVDVNVNKKINPISGKIKLKSYY